MSQPQEPWRLASDAQWAAGEEAEIPTLHLPGVAGNADTPPTHRLVDVAVADAAQETAILPSIDLLPTVKRAALKAPATESDAINPRQSAAPPPPPTRPRRRLFSTLVALGVFLVANVFVQLNRPYFDAESDGYLGLQRIQACESLGRVPDIIYLGSSRAVYGVSPSVIDAAVQQQTGKATLGCNVSTFGSTIDHDYYILKHMIDDGYAPKMVVENAWEYPLNLHANGQGRNGYSDADKSSPLNDEASWLATIRDAPDLYQKFKAGQGLVKFLNFVAERAIPLYGDRYGILRAICNGSTFGPCGASLPGVDATSAQRYAQADRQGFVALTGTSLADLSPGEISHAEHGEFDYGADLENFTIGGHQIDYLRKLITLAQSHHIRMVLVTSPLNPIFFYYLHPASDWRTKIVPFWKSIAAQYHIHYYDESHAHGYTNADWRDPEHLDADGAQIFSTWIANTIVIPAFSGASASG